MIVVTLFKRFFPTPPKRTRRGSKKHKRKGSIQSVSTTAVTPLILSTWGEEEFDRHVDVSWIEMLNDRKLFTEFRYHVYHKLANENLSFYIAVEVFRFTEHVIKRRAYASEIVRNWIDLTTASEPINISRLQRERILANKHIAQKNLFDDARTTILNMLRYDHFVAFMEGMHLKPRPAKALMRTQTFENYDKLTLLLDNENSTVAATM